MQPKRRKLSSFRSKSTFITTQSFQHRIGVLFLLEIFLNFLLSLQCNDYMHIPHGLFYVFQYISIAQNSSVFQHNFLRCSVILLNVKRLFHPSHHRVLCVQNILILWADTCTAQT